MWTSGSLYRNRDAYVQVCQQFDVENNPAYKPVLDAAGNISKTWCNFYVRDCTAALGVPIPQQVPKTISYEQDKLFVDFLNKSGIGWAVLYSELGANAQNDWLHSSGPSKGWWKISAIDAVKQACNGFPTVASFKNAPGKGSGHIAMVMPSDGEELLVSAAGASNLWMVPIVKSFGPYLPQVEYFTNS